MIKTALLFKVPQKDIREKLGVTNHQIALAKKQQLTLIKRQGKPKLSTPYRTRLKQWLEASSLHKQIAYRHIPYKLDLGLEYREKAICTGFKLLGYSRKVSKKKGYLDNLDVIAERLAFAQEAITWTPKRLRLQIFLDEVQAHRGAHTQQYVSCKLDNSDRYHSSTTQHKYSKLPSQMFCSTIVNSKKGPVVFQEKSQGNIDSIKYNNIILNSIQAFLQQNLGQGYIWIQDNAPSYKSRYTQYALWLRRIPYIYQLHYSPDLNLIEHVWNWIKNYIQRYYYAAYYNCSKIPLEQLQPIIQEAQQAVPNEFIRNLYGSQ